ncbi:hypothetical protein D9619_006830 [Psilocybe cf. subviscida]|uniref:Aminoglycoside phosphotransferase domain-containing protein n=1 Tax=Psilocybe cf. subviscida TaxID=2480587 RepID=A0A8H5B480_9AGAR|nr:hypothetical protein D9619_006830 [Psilocybe cf. subviscida]
MFCFRSIKIAAPIALRQLLSSSPRIISAITAASPRRALSTVVGAQDDIFNYTSGRWVYNEALRQQERRTVFNVDGLKRLAAQSVNRSVDDVVGFSKHAEDNTHRSFIVTLRDGWQMIARIPYPMTVPKYYTVASEAATIEYLRSSGVPAPKVYGYSPDSANAGGTAYLLTEHVPGARLSEVWPRLDDREIISVINQLTQLEVRMMALSFPAGGSIFFAKDLEKVAPGLGIPLDDKEFCIGPDLRLPLWYKGREKFVTDRGPYKTADAAFTAGAHKGLAYLKQFGQPSLPSRRERRRSLGFQAQLPSDHVENLNRFLSVAPALVPKDPTLTRFCIQHPDIQLDSIFVSRSTVTGEYEITGLTDWQHTAVLPMFLLAGLPRGIETRTVFDPYSLPPPALSDDFAELDADEQEGDMHFYRRQLIHYHYLTSTKQHNPRHHAAFTDPLHALRGALFAQASAPWAGESIDLKDALIEAVATEKWDALTAGAGAPVPCPVAFDAADLQETAALHEKVKKADRYFMCVQGVSRLGEDGWVSPENYEHAMQFLEEYKDEQLEETRSVDERNAVLDHWPWNDRDEMK